jgi:uncharacterized DUF497 family protein
MYAFRLNDWNINQIARHGVEPVEAESVVSHARRPYPEATFNDRFRVIGPDRSGRHMHVVCVPDVDGTAYIIHARDLTEPEKRRSRRRTR